jgi:hypothetical protein
MADRVILKTVRLGDAKSGQSRVYKAGNVKDAETLNSLVPADDLHRLMDRGVLGGKEWTGTLEGKASTKTVDNPRGDIRPLPGERAGGVNPITSVMNPPAGQPQGTPLPEDFPHRELLMAAGYNTIEKLSETSDEDVLAIKGIGQKALDDINAAL